MRPWYGRAVLARRAYWLIKSEPFVYSFAQLVKDGQTAWTGVRNFEARNNLRAMKAGDECLYYHSNEGKEIVGVARVVREGYQDPTTKDDWTAVDVAPVRALATPQTLGEMREHPLLGKMMLFKRGRLSVVPVTPQEFEAVIELGAKARANPAGKGAPTDKKKKRAVAEKEPTKKKR